MLIQHWEGFVTDVYWKIKTIYETPHFLPWCSETTRNSLKKELIKVEKICKRNDKPFFEK